MSEEKNEEEEMSQMLAKIDSVTQELKEFRDSQDEMNQLLLKEFRGLKTELRNFKEEVKTWK